MDRNNRPGVEPIPGKVSAAWLGKGTRIRADSVNANAANVTPRQIVEHIYPSLLLDRARRMIAFQGSPCAKARLMRTPAAARDQRCSARKVQSCNPPASKTRAHHPTAEPS
jgi:hypothetical protein